MDGCLQRTWDDLDHTTKQFLFISLQPNVWALPLHGYLKNKMFNKSNCIVRHVIKVRLLFSF